MKIIFSHTDLDGLGVYCLVKYYHISYDFFYILNYNEYEEYEDTIEQLDENDQIIFTDFSPNKKWMNILEKNNVKVKIYDHHGSLDDKNSACYMIKNWNYKNCIYFYEDHVSGTEIFFKNFIVKYYETKPIINQFCKLVTAFDCGLKDSPLYTMGTDLNRLFWKTVLYSKQGLERHDAFINNFMIYKFDHYTEFKWNKLEETKISEDKKRELEIFNNLIKGGKDTIKTRKDDLGRYFCVIKLRSKSSGISNMIFNKYKKVDYVLIINEYDKENKKLSFRGRDDKEGIDGNKLEGFKGHALACGYEQITNELCEDLWRGKIYSFPIRKDS